MNLLPMLVFAFFSLAAGAENETPVSIQKTVESLLLAKKYPLAGIGVIVSDVDRKTTLVAVSADSMFNPASVSKLVTAAAAYEKLGPQYNFTTRIFYDTVFPEGTGSAVRNLYIQGNGDPGFTAERLWLLVERMYHCGLRAVTGDIVLDDFLFDSIVVGPGFDEDSGSRAYQPLINALAVNFNCVAVHCRPGATSSAPAVCDIFPEMEGMKVRSVAAKAAPGKKSMFECATVPDSSLPGTCVTVTGAMKMDDPGFYAFHKLWRTWESFGAALKPLFARRGIRFTGSVVHTRVPKRVAARVPLTEFESQPLSDAVNDMFKYSSNFTAEILFKSLSARRDTVQGAWNRSSALVGGWWKEQGLPGKPVIKNGSGMGNTNLMSAAQIAALLLHVWEQKSYCPEYIAALSCAGVDGTTKSRFQKSKLKGLVRSKTGTLNDYGVSSLAGYLFLPGKGTYVFAILCNKTGHSQFEDWGIQEKILETVAEGVK